MSEDNQIIVPQKVSVREPSVGFSLSETPGIEGLLVPFHNDNPLVNEAKIRRLYLQASSQQWFSPQKINFGLEIDMEPEQRRVWIKFMTIFYTLEKMGLNVIANMMPKAVSKLRSEEMSYYLAAQCYDESRHVFTVGNYLKKLGAPPRYDWKLHILGQVASMGLYRVENWLFSTLFSENFASCFLRRVKNKINDPMGVEMCKYLLIDESRHLHFLHIVLPDIMDRLSLFGRGYVKMSQSFIMKFSEVMARQLEADSRIVGIDRRELLEDVFENVERAYAGFGVTRRFLAFPKVTSVTA